jgi:hypothetical protein
MASERQNAIVFVLVKHLKASSLVADGTVQFQQLGVRVLNQSLR